jgi:CRP-like cAMP-binding protein
MSLSRIRHKLQTADRIRINRACLPLPSCCSRAQQGESILIHQLQSPRCSDAVDPDLLAGLPGQLRQADKGKLLVVEGGLVDCISLLTRGWAIRYRSLPDGRRQILNFLLPGDLTGFFGLLSQTAAYGVEALTPVTLHNINADRLLDAFKHHPQLAVALCWHAGQVGRRLDEQILRIGRRSATEGMAHLFMELYHRLLQAGISRGDARCLPLTQMVLADALGMSHVHANRSFRSLVQQQLVTLDDGNVRLLDTQALSLYAGFNPGYLRQQTLPAALVRDLHGTAGGTPADIGQVREHPLQARAR